MGMGGGLYFPNLKLLMPLRVNQLLPGSIVKRLIKSALDQLLID